MIIEVWGERWIIGNIIIITRRKKVIDCFPFPAGVASRQWEEDCWLVGSTVTHLAK